MGSLGTVSIGTAVDTSGLTRGTKEAQEKTRSLGSSILSAVNTGINGFAKLGFASIGLSATIEALQAAFAKPLIMASDAEQWAVKFRIIEGSAEKAKHTLAELKAFRSSEGSMLDGDELKRAAASLLAIGVEADSIIPTIRNLSNISSGLSVPLESMVSMYEKVRETGHITSRELKSAAKEGVPLSQAFADLFQTSKKNVRDLAEKGLISFEHFEKALNNMNVKGGVFHDMNKEMTNTLGGAWNQFMAKVKERQTKFGQSIADTFKLTQAVQWLTSAYDTIMKVGEKAMGYIGAVVTPIGQGIMEIGGAIKDVFVAAADIVEQAIDWLDAKTQEYFPNLGKNLLDFGLKAEYTFKNFKQVASLAFTESWLGIVMFGNDVVDLFTEQLPKAWEWMGKNSNRIWDNIVNYAKYKWEQLKHLVADESDHLAQGLAVIGEKIGILPEGSARAVFDANKADKANRKAPEMPAMQKLDPFDLTKRNNTAYENELQKSIDRQQEIINKGFDKFLDEKKKAANGKSLLQIAVDAAKAGGKAAAEIPLKPKIETAELPTMAKKLSDILAPTALLGSKEARHAELSFRYGISKADNEPAKKTAKNSDKIVAVLERIENKFMPVQPVPEIGIA